MTEYCEFCNTPNFMLRDQLVCGVNSEQLQHQLLVEPRLSFERALELSWISETVTEDACSLQGKTKSTALSVNVVSQNVNTSALPPVANKPWYRCGNNHQADMCRFKQTMCHKCNNKLKGHISKVCHSNHSKPPSSRQAQTPRMSYLHQISQEETVHEAPEDDLVEFTRNYVGLTLFKLF